MRVWIDTEFNGFGGELISMALVAEDGSVFYESIGCGEPCAWVHENVMPIIGKDSIPMTEFWSKLEEFINQWEEIHIIADWPEDISHFCQALIIGPGYSIPTPKKMTFEVRRDIDAQSKLPHNALADAWAIRDQHLMMESNKVKVGNGIHSDVWIDECVLYTESEEDIRDHVKDMYRRGL